MIDYLEIGKIVNTHGLKGELKVIPLTDDPKRYNLLKSLYIDIKGELKEFDVQWVKYHDKFVILKLKGIDDIDLAQNYKNYLIKIHRKNAVKLETGRYFIVDLIGVDVYKTNGEKLGVLEDVIKTGSNDVYVVSTGGKNILIPALKSVVKLVDIEAKRMEVELPGGFLDDEV